jgi:hypothetical protein
MARHPIVQVLAELTARQVPVTIERGICVGWPFSGRQALDAKMTNRWGCVGDVGT